MTKKALMVLDLDCFSHYRITGHEYRYAVVSLAGVSSWHHTLELAKSARRARTFPDRFEIRATVEVPMAEARAAARARGKRKRAGEDATAYRIRFMAPRSAGDPKAIVFEAVVVGKRAAAKIYAEKRLELDPHYWGSASFGPVES